MKQPWWWRLRHRLAHLTHMNGCFGTVRAKLGGGWEYGVICKGCGEVVWFAEWEGRGE